MTSNKAQVLFIDDRDTISPRVLRELYEPFSIRADILHPEEVSSDSLALADVVIVDYFLSEWLERDEVDSEARKPRDGLAVISSLRSSLLPMMESRSFEDIPEKPVAFALWSGHLSAATFDLPGEVLPHVFSRENNVEWAFGRQDLLTPSGAKRVGSVAAAVLQLGADWPSSEATFADLARLLALDETWLWGDQAAEEVMSCRPPIHELGSRTRGMAVLRWLMHRILPYPTFLLDELEICARLHVDFLPPDAPFWSMISEYEYQGALSEFAGRRWWRAGFEDWLFETTAHKSDDSSLLTQLAISAGGSASQTWVHPVVTIDGDLKRRSDLTEVADVVRVMPDDWPIYADAAYARRQDVITLPTLGRLVDSLDRDLLETED